MKFVNDLWKVLNNDTIKNHGYSCFFLLYGGQM
jgi:hypothetical protein